MRVDRRANALPIARAVVANTGAPQPSTPIGSTGPGDISHEIGDPGLKGVSGIEVVGRVPAGSNGRRQHGRVLAGAVVPEATWARWRRRRPAVARPTPTSGQPGGFPRSSAVSPAPARIDSTRATWTGWPSWLAQATASCSRTRPAPQAWETAAWNGLAEDRK